MKENLFETKKEKRVNKNMKEYDFEEKTKMTPPPKKIQKIITRRKKKKSK